MTERSAHQHPLDTSHREDDDAPATPSTQQNTVASLLSDHAATDVRSLPDALWVYVAVFGDPRTVCNVEQLSKPIRAALSAAAKGTQIAQRYWHAQCQRLRWEPDGGAPLAPLSSVGPDERKRRLLTHTLSKSEGKKSWKQEYQGEYEGYLRRNLRGVGVRHRDVVRTTTVVERLNAALPPQGSPLEVHDAPPTAGEVPTDAFAQMCLDAGVHSEHFTTRHGTTAYADASHQRPTSCEPTATDREAYRANKALGKRKGKHAKGKASLWTAWVQD